MLVDNSLIHHETQLVKCSRLILFAFETLLFLSFSAIAYLWRSNLLLINSDGLFGSVLDYLFGDETKLDRLPLSFDANESASR